MALLSELPLFVNEAIPTDLLTILRGIQYRGSHSVALYLIQEIEVFKKSCSVLTTIV